MTDIKGVNATLAQNSPKEMIKVSDQGGRVRVLYDEYVFDGVETVTSGENIDLGAPLPKGSRIHYVSCDVSQLATAPDLISVDPDGSETDRIAALASGVSSGDFDELPSEDQMKLEWQASETPGAGTLKIAIFYSSGNS